MSTSASAHVTALQLASQFVVSVAKASAVHAPSRLRSTGKHAARDVLLAAQHERWIGLPNHQRPSDDFPGTSRMSAPYASPEGDVNAITVSLATMAALPPQLAGILSVHPPRSKPKTAKSFVAAFPTLHPYSQDPSANPIDGLVRTTHTTLPYWTSIMQPFHRDSLTHKPQF